MHRHFILTLCLSAGVLAGQTAGVTAIFAAGSNGMTRSLDGGATWESANNGLADDPLRSVVASVSVQPPILYAAATGSVYRSADLASSWRRILSGVTVDKLAVDPLDAKVLYALASGVLWKTIDGGDTWSTLETPGLSTIEADYKRSDRLYGVARLLPFGSLFYYSEDGGVSWQAAGIPLPWLHTALAADPIAPDSLYINSYDGLFQSADGGRSWTTFGSADLILGRPPGDVGWLFWRGFERTSALISDPVRSGDIYACVTEETDASTGYYEIEWFIARVLGRWRKLSPPYGCTSLARDPNSDGVVYAGGSTLFRINVVEGSDWAMPLEKPNPISAVVAVSIDKESGK